jgi:hypothetical protein
MKCKYTVGISDFRLKILDFRIDSMQLYNITTLNFELIPYFSAIKT